jgi:hypothetical protein
MKIRPATYPSSRHDGALKLVPLSVEIPESSWGTFGPIIRHWHTAALLERVRYRGIKGSLEQA